jgi:hypothetical protein
MSSKSSKRVRQAPLDDEAETTRQLVTSTLFPFGARYSNVSDARALGS